MRAWHVAATKTHREEVAEDNLKNQDFEVYLPRLRVETAKGADVKISYQPLFPGYIFVRFDPTIRSAGTINNTLGITKLLSFGKNLAVMLNSEMNHMIQEAEKIDSIKNGALFLKAGDEVEIVDGPLKGLTAIFKETNGERRTSLLMVMMFNKQWKHVTVSNQSFK